MEHVTTDQDGFAVTAVTGDVDFNSSPELRTVLLELIEARRDVLVDMSAVSYIDSSGVASLIEAYQTAKSLNTRFGLVAVGGTPLRVLQVARLEKIFPMYPTVADGVAAKA
jgi:anti-sigma B factor antagonist